MLHIIIMFIFQYRDGPHRINSSEKVKKIIQTEGRTARNLVIYNVPLQPGGVAGSQAGIVELHRKRDTCKVRI